MKLINLEKRNDEIASVCKVEREIEDEPEAEVQPVDATEGVVSDEAIEEHDTAESDKDIE